MEESKTAPQYRVIRQFADKSFYLELTTRSGETRVVALHEDWHLSRATRALIEEFKNNHSGGDTLH